VAVTVHLTRVTQTGRQAAIIDVALRTRLALLTLLLLLVAVATADAADPSRCALLIGIDSYHDPNIPRVAGASRDASSLRRWLLESAGWKPRDVLLMTNSGNTRHASVDDPVHNLLPTARNLDWAFQEWLPGRLREGAVVTVYIAGRVVGARGRESIRALDREWSLADALDASASGGIASIVCWLDLGRTTGDPLEPAVSRLPVETARWPGVSVWTVDRGTEGGFADELIATLARPAKPRTVLGSLDRLNRSATLRDRGFRTIGGVSAGLTLDAEVEPGRSSERAEPRLLLQRGHDGPVSFLAVTADGDRLVSGGSDSAVKVWRLGDRMLTRALHAHTVGVSAGAMSGDGRYLATGDPNGQVYVHNLIDGRSLAAVPAQKRGIDQIAFLPDGSRFVTLTIDGIVVLWDAANRSRVEAPLAETAHAIASSRRADPVALAVVDRAKGIRLYGPDGSWIRDLELKVKSVTAAALSVDGRVLALGDASGILAAVDTETGAVRLRREFSGKVTTLEFSSRGALAIGAGDELVLLPSLDPGGLPFRRPVQGRLTRVTFTSDGRRLGVLTASGALVVYQLGGLQVATPIPLADDDPDRQATSLAFTPDGLALVAGDADGGIRSWDLGHEGVQRPRIPGHRGKVVALAIAPAVKDRGAEGRDLLQITEDGEARVWDLQEGLVIPVDVPGADGARILWNSGAIFPERAGLAMTTREGDVVFVPWPGRGRLAAQFFERPTVWEGKPAEWRFRLVAVSPDGKKVAAGSTEAPLLRIWEKATGKPIRTIREHADALTSLVFSADSKRLLSSSLDGSARIWDVSSSKGPAQLARFQIGKDAVTAASFLVGVPSRVVTGHRSGRIFVWEDAPPHDAKPVELGRLEEGVDVKAIVAAPDGSRLAVAGSDRSMRLWRFDASPRQPVPLLPRHDEQINAMATSPLGTFLASGSDDGTVRLWNWGAPKPSLLGTLSALGTHDWIVHTEAGYFDGSNEGLSQVSWQRGARVEPLEQYAETLRVFRLADQLRRLQPPKPPDESYAMEPPANLAIDPPSAEPSTNPEATLTVTLSDPEVVELRLYQDGIPVAGPDDFITIAPNRRQTKVRLRPGANRFHAMAGRKGGGSADGRSREVVIHHAGKGELSRLHLLAIGVGNHPRHALKFAAVDAQGIADIVRARSAGPGTGGLTISLVDGQVTSTAIDLAFDRLRAAVREHPRDSVVVFLAGPSRAAGGQFRLLLPAGEGPEPALLYATVCRKLSQLQALRRLVVVDAGPSADRSDSNVRDVQRLVDDGSRRARASYILAIPRSDPAQVAATLGHGLLPYVLLRGFGAEGSVAGPDLPAFRTWPTADLDRDGIVTTEEIRAFVEAAFPELAARYSEGTTSPGSTPARLVIDSVFPLVKLKTGGSKR
jgi:WD40 repeat protein